MSSMRLVVVYECLQWGILSVYMFLESYCSNCIWFVMRNLLLILLMMSWEIIRVGDYEYFVHDFLAVQFFWFNLIEKKNREKSMSSSSKGTSFPHKRVYPIPMVACKLTPKKLKFALAVYIEVKFMFFWMF